jgi:AcrR family transcriptional regulator
MQDIAEAVELKKGSLYHHVSSKQEILLALLDEALDLIIERLQAVEAKNLSPVLILEHRSLQSEFIDLHIPRRDRIEQIWREIIEEGVSCGELQSQQPGLTAKALLGVLNWAITWYREDGPLSPNEIADHFADLFIQGLLIH